MHTEIEYNIKHSFKQGRQAIDKEEHKSGGDYKAGGKQCLASKDILKLSITLNIHLSKAGRR
jgi:hypothetical protein